MSLLEQKQILIAGMISDRSLAYGIAKSMHKQGAKLAFTYQSPAVKDRVAALAKEFNSDLLFTCDVSSDEQITKVFSDLSEEWSSLDGLVHSIASAPLDSFAGSYLESVNRHNFSTAHEISSYSLAAMCKQAAPMLSKSAAIVAISYLGSTKAVTGYNVMGIAKASLEANVRYLANDLGLRGIRVNAISAGPYKSLSTARSPVIDKNIKHYAKHSPLRRNISLEEIGNTASFLCSDMSSGITGQIIYVDGGYSIVEINTHE